MLHAILSHVIHVHFNYLCFHVHEVSFVLALEREKSKGTPSFSPLNLLFKELQPLQTFLIHTLILLFSLSFFFWQKGWPLWAAVLQLKTYNCFAAQNHNIFRIIFKTSYFKQPGTLPLSAVACWAELFTQPAVLPFRDFPLSGYTQCSPSCFVSLVSTGSHEQCWLCWSWEAISCACCSEKDVSTQSNPSCPERLMSQPYQCALVPSPAGNHPSALIFCRLKDIGQQWQVWGAGNDSPWPLATSAFSRPNFKGMLSVPGAAQRWRVSAQAASRFLL